MINIKKRAAMLLVVVLLVSSLTTGCGGTKQTSATESEILYMASYCAPVIDWDPSICFSLRAW